MSKKAELESVAPAFGSAHRDAASREVKTGPVQRPVAKRPTPAPAVRDTLAPVQDIRTAETAEAGDEAWRRFVAPQAERGSAGQNRLNIPMPQAAMQKINQYNYQLGQEKTRWRINRTLLTEAAIEILEQDPDKWRKRLSEHRTATPEKTVHFAARVSDSWQERVDMLRLTPEGERPVGPLLGLVIGHLLGADSSESEAPEGQVPEQV